MENLKLALKKSAKSFWSIFPIILSTILLVSIATALIPKSAYSYVFRNIPILDSLIGGILGSILAGNPITSYIIGGELLSQGVGLIAVTSFILCWVTVGLVQLPAESMILGKKFAITRNISAFVISIIAAFVTAGLVIVI